MTKPIFCIGIPNATYDEIQKVKEATLYIQNDYYVIPFRINGDEVSFQLFNSSDLEATDLETIKKHITDLTNLNPQQNEI